MRFKEIIDISKPTKNNIIYTKDNFSKVDIPIPIKIDEDRIIGKVDKFKIISNNIFIEGEIEDKYIMDNASCTIVGFGKINNDTHTISEYKLLYFEYSCVPAIENIFKVIE